MPSPILHDFNVQLLSESPEQSLYGKANPLFYHFVLTSSKNEQGWLTLSQFFFPRLGFSKAMLAKFDSPKNPLQNLDNPDLFPEYLQALSPYAIDATNGPEFFMDFGTGPISLGKNKRGGVTAAILNDGLWYKEFISSGQADATRTFVSKYPDQLQSKSPDALVEMAKRLNVLPDLEFELSKLLRNTKNKEAGFFELVCAAMETTGDFPEHILDFWMDPLISFAQKSTCECGNKYCFFEIGKKIQLKYFPENYNDSESVKSFWQNLPTAKQAVLLFMAEIENLTPLIALDIFEEDFNIGYLSALLCSMHQPDSPDEWQTRKHIALNDYFWKKQVKKCTAIQIEQNDSYFKQGL